MDTMQTRVIVSTSSTGEIIKSCELSPDVKSDSGYSTISTGSISDQTGHVAGVTMAALELVNENHITQTSEMHDEIGSYGPDNMQTVISSFLDENRSYTDSYSAEKFENTSFTPLLNAKPMNNENYNLTNEVPSPNEYKSTISQQDLDSTDPLPFNYQDEMRNDMRQFGENSQDVYYEPESSVHGQTSVIVRAPSAHSDSDLSNLSQDFDQTIVKQKKRLSSRDNESHLGKSQGTRENISRPPQHVLPPCKVCGVQATGFHYGVNTCEACKGFFRRSIIRKQPYNCANNPVKCAISPGKRKTCPSCRYKRCLEAGMSVEGIKIGRYTYAKRTQDILELKHTDPPPTDTIPQQQQQHQQQQQQQQHHHQQPQQQQKPSADRKQEIQSGLPSNVQSEVPPSTRIDVHRTQNNLLTGVYSHIKLESSVNLDTNDPDAVTVNFVQIVLQANELKYPESLKDTTLVEQIQQQVKEQHARGEIPASMNQVPMEKFMSVLNTTGVQMDNRIQILQQWVVLLNDGLRYVVSFAKEIPGFKDLKLPDQMALIKHSICEVWIISRHMAFHEDFDYFTTRTGMTIDVSKTLGEEFSRNILRVTRRLRKLNLVKQETIMLKALVIFFTDRCEIEEPEKAEVIRHLLLDSLQYLLKQRGANDAHTIGQISAVLTELRLTTEMYQEYTKKLQLMSSATGAMELPPLLQEVMNVS